MDASLHSRLIEWGLYFSGGYGRLGYGRNPIVSMIEPHQGSSGDPPRSAIQMDAYIRQLMNYRGRQYRDVILMEVGVDGAGIESQRARAKKLKMSHQSYRNYLLAAAGFLEGCISVE